MKTFENNTKANDKQRKIFDLKDFGFGALDISEDAEFLITSMDNLFAVDAIKAIKGRAINSLQLSSGKSVLELGCGLGEDAESIGKLVGETGHVIALDASELMISEAKIRSKAKQVQYVVGNANQLDYADDTFDACHIDRLLVSQKIPKQVLKESIRTLKKGGRISVTDCDFGSIVIHPYNAEIIPILIKQLQDIIENPLMGRQLHALFKESGFVDVSIMPEPYILRSFKQLCSMLDIPRVLNDICQQGKLTRKMADELLQSFQKADEEDNFLYGITFFTAYGRKP